MDDFVLMRITTIDGETEEIWLPPIFAVAVLYDLSMDEDIYSARIHWMADQNSRAWDMSV